MSPRETLLLHPAKAAGPETAPLLLEDYGITSNGFLPNEPPLERLPDPYYAPWEDLVGSLPTSLAQQTFRRQVDELPVLSTDRLTTEPEWRRAYVVMAFLAHAYIWGGDTASEARCPRPPATRT
jgi:indoleamine 2,3-dioxygenase